MDINELKSLLQKYQHGTCSPAEEKLIEDWLSALKSDRAEYFNDAFIEEQLAIAKSGIDQIIGNVPVIGKRRPYWWLAAAASLVIGSSIAFWALHVQKQPANTLANQNGTIKQIKNGWVYIQTPKGRTEHIQLTDGSIITLDASSNLRYPLKFVNHKRPIYLDEGEALFDVAKDKTSPFTVYTPKFATTALGTAFNIRSYAKEHRVSISLIHGKIRVDDLHPAQKTLVTKILLPHQQLVLDKQSGGVIKSNFGDETPITAWKDGVLSFNDATMDEVLNSIENRFNVTIKNNSGRNNWSYTGTFKVQQLNDVLKTVCLTEGISSYSIVNNKITLN